MTPQASGSPLVTVLALARGPERLVERAVRNALAQTGPSIEVVVAGDAAALARARLMADAAAPGVGVRWVECGATPGSARNAGVQAASAPHVLLVGGEAIAPGHAHALLSYVRTGARLALAIPVHDAGGIRAPWTPITAADAVAGPWCFGSPLLLERAACDRLGGFDDHLVEFVDWEYLLRALDAGDAVLSAPAAAGPSDDDIQRRESLRSERHLPAIRHIVGRHHACFTRHAPAAVAARERMIAGLRRREGQLRADRAQAEADLDAARETLTRLGTELAAYGRRTLEFDDLRRPAPISRNWGLDRGLPIDRVYIHAFMERHAADVQGDVLEVLDDEFTTTYGRDRVRRCDVLDIDPGNHRATVVADLRAAGDLAECAYDCVILTQTLHLIDDMAGALMNAHRALKPGGVLLMTLPSASMVAEEYGSRGDHWRVTAAGARALAERAFEPPAIEVSAFGNVLTTTAFLYGLGRDDLDARELDHHDPAYPTLVTVRARKAERHATVAAAPRPSAVLLYHRVASLAHDVHRLAVTPEAFRSQIGTLTRDWQVVPLGDLVAAATAGRPPEGCVALTFDDGYLDNLEVVLPILEEFSAPATFFLTTAALDRPHRYWWDVLAAALLDNPALGRELALEIDGTRQTFAVHDAAARQAAHATLYGMIRARGPAARDPLVAQLDALVGDERFDSMARPLGGDEVRRLARHPLIELGAHTVHHLPLSSAAPDDLFRDVFESRSALERLIGRPVRHFAYPYGLHAPAAVRTVEAAGFDAAVTGEGRPLRAREHRLRIPRIVVIEEGGTSLGSRLAGLTREAGTAHRVA